MSKRKNKVIPSDECSSVRPAWFENINNKVGDLNYYTNEIGVGTNSDYGKGCDIYGFKCFVKNAGTIYIDNISKGEEVEFKTAAKVASEY